MLRFKIASKRIVLIASIILIFSDAAFGADFLPIKRFIIMQNGMYPSLPAKSTFWVRKKPFLSINGIHRGDIVVYSQEKDGKIFDFVWRVIGLPGDHIRIRDTDIIINGQKISRVKKEETSIHIIFSERLDNIEYSVAYSKTPDLGKRIDIDINIPKEMFFLMGDNRDNALDGRFTGPVSFGKIIGKKM